MSNLITPCAACKCLMKECTEDCIFAPYFPPNQLEKFFTINKVFDASNISKLLKRIPESQRADAVNSMALEAEARILYPVHGCKGYVAILKDKLKLLQDELKKLAQNQEVAHLLHGHPDLLDEFTQFLPDAVAHVEGNLKQTLKSSSKL